MAEVFNALLGPAATVAAVMYWRAAYLKRKAREAGLTSSTTMLCAGFVLAYLAFWRAMAVFGFTTVERATLYNMPMGLGAYAIHIYFAHVVAQRAQMMEHDRERIRIEMRRQVDSGWGDGDSRL